MKRAIVPIFVLFLVSGIAVAVTSFLPHRKPSHSNAPPDQISESPRKVDTVSYGGVSFTYPTSLASSVEPETIPASVEGKPCDLWPEHPLFSLIGSSLSRSQANFKLQIRVFPLSEFRKAFAIASKENAKSVVYPRNPPAWTTYFDEEVRVLKSLLAAKPPLAKVRLFLGKARGEPSCSAAMPFLPMWEACQAFVGHVRYVNFKNGKGVFFLTQCDRETEQISNAGLECAYQGITNDGRYWVYAEFAVAASFLRNGTEPEVLSWDQKNYLLLHRSKEYQNYLRPVLAKLEALPANEFRPDWIYWNN